MAVSSLLNQRHSELVIGLVYPLGTDRDLVIRAVEDHLKKFGYETRRVHVSAQFERLEELRGDLRDSPEYDRISSRMEAGNKARRRAKRADFATLAAISEVSKDRTGEPAPEPVKRRALLIDSLKRPEEVEILRRIYGAGFFLIGVSASEATRRSYLEDDKYIETEKASSLMQRDSDEADSNGQRTTKTFHLADVFVSLDDQQYKERLWRFLDLVFGHPHATPTADEHAMYLAFAASFRSGDLSRQVGAAITSEDGDLISVGCNDVPRFGGGLYWSGDDDQRDAQLGYDSNHRRREEIVEEVLDRVNFPEPRDEARMRLSSQGPLSDITEYGRAVHAEMEALLACARTSRTPRGGTLYTTTFPCHNCARHVVAAGVRRVVYVEPYPKSKATELHSDSICLLDKGRNADEQHVQFEPFVGVGPRRYMDLFSISLGGGSLKKRKQGTQSVDWEPGVDSEIRSPMLPTSYLERERLAVDEIQQTLESLGGMEDA